MGLLNFLNGIGEPKQKRETTFSDAVHAMSRNHDAMCSCESCRIIARSAQARIDNRGKKK